jgi:ribosomal protein S18 acetylase RimI-like enzyme
VLNRYAGLEPYSLLLNRCISFLTKLKTVDRIETQLFPFNFESEPLLRAMQFSALKRFFLTLELTGDSPSTTAGTPGSPQPFPFRIVDWSQQLVKPGAGVIYDSHVATPDRFLCRDYQTEKGSFRLLTNLIDHPACGQFSPRETKLALDSKDRLCGILVASRIKPDTGMVPQLSVRRDCQGRGLGSMLMRSYLQRAKQAGLKRTTLSVSEANTKALLLYSKLGFKPMKEFHAYVWQR